MRAPLLRASAALLVVAALTGCSWRLETPTPQWPSPDAVTQMRDAAAVREQQVIDAAARQGESATAQAAVLSEIETAAAPERLDALGGVYKAYPTSSPSPSPSDAPLDLVSAAERARDGHLADALVAEDHDLAFMLGSAGLSLALSAWYAAWVEDAITEAAQPVVELRLLMSDAVPESQPVPAVAGVGPDILSDLALLHDQARYAYEVLAARAPEEEQSQWIERRDLQAARADALVELPGVEDQREPVYVLPDDASNDAAARMATARTLERGAGETYARLLGEVEPADMAWVLNAAFDAYAQAAAFGDPTASSYGVPALPGLTVEGDA